MATQPLQSDGFRLKQVFRSDSLPTLRKFLEMSPDLKSLVDDRVLQIRAIVDTKDLPHLPASQELGLPVFTSDRHLQKMGAPVLWVCIDTTCRDYIRTDTAACGHARFDEVCRDHARSTSVTIGFTLGSTFTVTIGVETLQAAAHGIKKLFAVV